jgi:hypothetical protein
MSLYLSVSLSLSLNHSLYFCLSYSVTSVTIYYQVKCALLYIENDAEIYPVHYTWKVAEKGFMMAFMINKLAMINSCKIIIEK